MFTGRSFLMISAFSVLVAAPVSAMAQATPDYDAAAIRERLSGVTTPQPAPQPGQPPAQPDPDCKTLEQLNTNPKCFAPAAGTDRQLFIYQGQQKSAAAPPAIRRPTASVPTVNRTNARTTASTTPRRPRGAAPAVASASNAAAASCVDQVADQALGLNLCVTFALGSAELTPKAKANLDQFSAAIAADEFKTLKFTIEGHADATGTDEVNRALSTQRAESVVAYLATKGVSRDRLTFAGFGAERPITGQSPTAAVNRRVEARLIR